MDIARRVLGQRPLALPGRRLPPDHAYRSRDRAALTLSLLAPAGVLLRPTTCWAVTHGDGLELWRSEAEKRLSALGQLVAAGFRDADDLVHLLVHDPGTADWWLANVYRTKASVGTNRARELGTACREPRWDAVQLLLNDIAKTIDRQGANPLPKTAVDISAHLHTNLAAQCALIVGRSAQDDAVRLVMDVLRWQAQRCGRMTVSASVRWLAERTGMSTERTCQALKRARRRKLLGRTRSHDATPYSYTLKTPPPSQIESLRRGLIEAGELRDAESDDSRLLRHFGLISSLAAHDAFAPRTHGTKDGDRHADHRDSLGSGAAITYGILLQAAEPLALKDIGGAQATLREHLSKLSAADLVQCRVVERGRKMYVAKALTDGERADKLAALAQQYGSDGRAARRRAEHLEERAHWHAALSAAAHQLGIPSVTIGHGVIVTAEGHVVRLGTGEAAALDEAEVAKWRGLVRERARTSHSQQERSKRRRRSAPPTKLIDKPMARGIIKQRAEQLRAQAAGEEYDLLRRPDPIHEMDERPDRYGIGGKPAVSEQLAMVDA